MSYSIDISQIKEKLSAGGPILVLLGNQAGVDQAAAGLSLFLVLKELGYEVSVSAPVEPRAEFSRLVGLDQLTQSISNRDLVIVFNEYDFENIEKVSHNKGEQRRFELIIQPKAGARAPQQDKVEFAYRGVNASLIFLMGINRLEDLGELYDSERGLFQQATTVAINRRTSSTLASISVVDQAAGSLCEVVMELMEQLGMVITSDVASNLLAGIDFATNRFQNPNVTAGSFMAAGKLLQLGAKRQPPRVNNFDNGGFMPFVPSSNSNQPPSSPRPVKPPSGQQPPEDWLKPKIFTGTSKV